jgi:hypothetical protein
VQVECCAPKCIFKLDSSNPHAALLAVRPLPPLWQLQVVTQDTAGDEVVTVVPCELTMPEMVLVATQANVWLAEARQQPCDGACTVMLPIAAEGSKNNDGQASTELGTQASISA